jgi:hypothetical protein
MLFVALGKVRAGTVQERTARRLEWRYPEGAKVVAEYWLQTQDPNVITVFEADTIAPIMAATTPWDDVFDFTIVPAVSAEEGLEIARHMMAA